MRRFEKFEGMRVDFVLDFSYDVYTTQKEVRIVSAKKNLGGRICQKSKLWI